MNPSPTSRRRRSSGGERNSAHLTPKSSWESFEKDSSVKETDTQFSPSTSRPVQSNNPFRQDQGSILLPERPTYDEERDANPWNDNEEKIPLSLSQPNPWAEYSSGSSFEKTDMRPLQPQESLSSSLQEDKSRYRHGLEDLVLPPDTISKSQQASSIRSFPQLSEEAVSKDDFGTRELELQSDANNKLQSLPPPVPQKLQPDVEEVLQIPENLGSISTGQTDTRRTSETYQIRLITWVDTSAAVNPRRSPIMVQNANGPCPLLALVNALVLSTPSNLQTALVETLRVREQVSLGLLLDAVIDELMSGRRGNAAQNLPDVSELYAFLVTLHTGMNVNPCFVSTGEDINLMDAPVDVPQSAHDFRKPGGFEETREMRLYSVFAVPLIHGWIPPRTHPAFAALKRRAKTYEDAQNLMFREEDLEEKLKGQGLDPDEQLVLEDIASVKYFLSSTATQLTGYGLDTISEALAPGSLAILFRNDHFSTLYRHPRSGQLLTIVTDMGYAGHDEVVWESLVDVNGEGSAFFSGDFRAFGDSLGEAPQNDEGWTTVANRTRKSSQRIPRNVEQQSQMVPLQELSLGEEGQPKSPNTVQEDHDLALAMQLQEEEEEHDRRQSAARRREDELSQAYLDNADSQGRRTFPGFARGARSAPNVPPRGGSNVAPNSRQPVRRQEVSDEPPPPTYEQAAKGPAYHPPNSQPYYPSTPSPTASRPPLTQIRRSRGSSAYSEHAARYGGSPSVHTLPRSNPPPPRGRGPSMEGLPSQTRRRNGAPVSAGVDEERKEKDCIIM